MPPGATLSVSASVRLAGYTAATFGKSQQAAFAAVMAAQLGRPSASLTVERLDQPPPAARRMLQLHSFPPPSPASFSPAAVVLVFSVAVTAVPDATALAARIVAVTTASGASALTTALADGGLSSLTSVSLEAAPLIAAAAFSPPQPWPAGLDQPSSQPDHLTSGDIVGIAIAGFVAALSLPLLAAWREARAERRRLSEALDAERRFLSLYGVVLLPLEGIFKPRPGSASAKRRQLGQPLGSWGDEGASSDASLDWLQNHFFGPSDALEALRMILLRNRSRRALQPPPGPAAFTAAMPDAGAKASAHAPAGPPPAAEHPAQPQAHPAQLQLAQSALSGSGQTQAQAQAQSQSPLPPAGGSGISSAGGTTHRSSPSSGQLQLATSGGASGPARSDGASVDTRITLDSGTQRAAGLAQEAQRPQSTGAGGRPADLSQLLATQASRLTPCSTTFHAAWKLDQPLLDGFLDPGAAPFRVFGV